VAVILLTPVYVHVAFTDEGIFYNY